MVINIKVVLFTQKYKKNTQKIKNDLESFSLSLAPVIQSTFSGLFAVFERMQTSYELKKMKKLFHF